MMTGSEIVQLAKQELAGLTGLEADTVSGLRHDIEGGTLRLSWSTSGASPRAATCWKATRCCSTKTEKY